MAEKKQEDYLQTLKDLRLTDDVFLTEVLQDPKCVKYILDTILDEDLTILESKIEVIFPDMYGEGISLDVCAENSKGKLVGIQVQHSEAARLPMYARKVSSLLGAKYPGSDEDEDIPDIFVIFLMDSDLFHSGSPIYHITSRIKETGERVDDGSYLIYVISSIQNENTKAGRLMHDFTVQSAAEMHQSVLADRVRSLKETEEGQRTMCKILEDMSYEEVQKARVEKRTHAQKQMVRTLAETMSAERIAEILELPFDFVQGALI